VAADCGGDVDDWDAFFCHPVIGRACVAVFERLGEQVCCVEPVQSGPTCCQGDEPVMEASASRVHSNDCALAQDGLDMPHLVFCAGMTAYDH
jgi:hypothetical protein